jgi:squalene-hopene/tetraprenyl-beta-curcumene cyclase
MKILLALTFALSLHAATAPGSWDPDAAVKYLDARAEWWTSWKSAARDHDTFCVSCHTTLPYMLARPALRTEKTPAAPEQKILDNVKKRVRLGSEVEPFYKGAKAVESRGTEVILNALILVSFDAHNGNFGADARTALDQMLDMQEKSGDLAGSIVWMDFHYQPWEAGEARYWGATLAAEALGTAPADYRLRPGIRDQVDSLRAYLQKNAEGQPLYNRASLLLASTRLPGLLSAAQRHAIVNEIGRAQNADGGWTATVLLPSDWKRRDSTPLETRSDGYATAYLTYVLQQAGTADNQVNWKKGKQWLESNHDRASGKWAAWSMNKQRDPESDPGKFMSDAATAYAALALRGK